MISAVVLPEPTGPMMIRTKAGEFMKSAQVCGAV